ncbi:CIC11C00000003615 [Sungouiella intermedia]|uniref:Transcription initiation factor IIF subunit beta n=1 Tax=Sungouiella intermedia TaxID=45354 RepID=A0A1L0CTS6_9ASCO|nr:CIC11C00000003615 [[Candida] intermedia]
MSTKSPLKKIIKETTTGVPSGNSPAGLGANLQQNQPKQEEDDGVSLLSDPEDYLDENESLDMNLARGNQKVWFVKLPRYLAEKWTNPDNLNGQQLGQVKIRQNTGGNGKRKLEVKLVLNDTPDSETIPHEYDLSILNTQVHNSYVFSEENLKRFKQEVTEIADMPDAPELPDLNQDESLDRRPNKFFRVQKNGEEEKVIPFVKTIPKKTNLVGKIVHDCQIVPLKSDRRYAQMLAKRQNMPLTKARPKVTFLNEIPGVVQSQAGPSITGRSTSLFLKSSNAAKNKADGRAIRMPKKDLLDLLFRLFEEYEYWSMKGLKERTRQPETYLKESLELIANLIKKGPYTSKYNLKPEYKRLRDAERAARLGQAAGEDNDNDKDEDDDIEMEDII